MEKIFQTSFKKRAVALFVILVIGVPFFLYQYNLVKNNKSTLNPETTFYITEAAPIDQVFQETLITKPTFKFSKKLGILEEDLEKYFSITPPIKGASWYFEDNSQTVIYGSRGEQFLTIVENIPYTITIKKTLKSFDGKSLKEGLTTTFRAPELIKKF